MNITRLNHAVLYVRDAERSAGFFVEHLGFEVTGGFDMGGGRRAVFVKAGGSPNDHDLGLFTIGDAAADSSAGRSTVGLYHLAWEVPTLADLARLQESLRMAGALVGQSDHGVSKSLYARDPDGLEFELMWAVPEDLLTDDDASTAIAPLDLQREIDRFGADTPGRTTVAVPG